jgi:uncharacterized Ntn-hydrolase superfamily protein
MTYSIVACDPDGGEFGVAVQSQSFNTGAAVPWARPGAGAIATQSFTDRRYGYRGLELLDAGRSAQDALDELIAPDDDRAFRQVAMIDLTGAVAQWTGEHCVPCCGHSAGEGWAAQGNMLAAEAWHAMGRAFETAAGTLAERLMAALEAAEAEGGDWRGRGGAGIVVVPKAGDPWERVIDLRVEDGDDSLVQLRRLLERAEAFRAARRAENKAETGAELGLPATFVTLLALEDAGAAGDTARGRRLLSELAAENARWLDFARSFSQHPAGAHLRDILEDDA